MTIITSVSLTNARIVWLWWVPVAVQLSSEIALVVRSLSFANNWGCVIARMWRSCCIHKQNLSLKAVAKLLLSATTINILSCWNIWKPPNLASIITNGQIYSTLHLQEANLPIFHSVKILIITSLQISNKYKTLSKKLKKRKQ